MDLAVNAKTPPEGWSSLSTIEKASLEGLFWLVTEKCEFGRRSGDGAFSLAQTFTPGEMEQMIYLNLLQEVSLGFALAGYPIEDEEKVATGSSSFAELLDPIATAPGSDMSFDTLSERLG